MRLIDADALIECWKAQLKDMKSYGIEYCESAWEKVFADFITDVREQEAVEAIPIDKPFLKMKYKGYTVYKTEWLKEHIEMEYRVIKGISESKPEAIPIEWIEEYCYENWAEYSSPHDAIRRMLEDWREENG